MGIIMLKHRSLLTLLLIKSVILSLGITGCCYNVKGYGTAKLANLLEAIDKEDFESFQHGLAHNDIYNDIRDRYTEEEFSGFVSSIKEKYGDYKKYSTEFISSSSEGSITTAYFNAIYSKNPKVKILVQFTIQGEQTFIADFKFED